MKPGDSMPHSQGLSNNSYPEPNQPNYPQNFNISSTLNGPVFQVTTEPLRINTVCFSSFEYIINIKIKSVAFLQVCLMIINTQEKAQTPLRPIKSKLRTYKLITQGNKQRLGWGLSWQIFFSSHLMMIPQSNNVLQLVRHIYYVDTAVQGINLHCYNTEGDRNSVASQSLCRLDVTRLES